MMDLTINGQNIAVIKCPKNSDTEPRVFSYEEPVVAYLSPGTNHIRLTTSDQQSGYGSVLIVSIKYFPLL